MNSIECLHCGHSFKFIQPKQKGYAMTRKVLLFFILMSAGCCHGLQPIRPNDNRTIEPITDLELELYYGEPIDLTPVKVKR